MLQLFDSDEKPFFVAKKLAPSIFTGVFWLHMMFGLLWIL